MKLRLLCASVALFVVSALNSFALTILTNDNLVENGLSEDDTQYIGYYAITNTEDLYAFADSVNSGLTNINGVLLADIDLKNNNWIPIGTCTTHEEGNFYNGYFDGRGHTVSNFVSGIDTTLFFAGLFGGLDEYAHITNLGIINATISAGKAAGAIAGGITLNYSGVQINDCWAINCTISALGENENAGGIIGGFWSNWNPISNCYTYNVTVTAENSGQFAGSDPYSSNCYTLGAIDINEDKTVKQFKTGEVCYLLNSGYTDNPTWRQTIGIDTLPTQDTTHGIVYQALGCSRVYSNNPDSVAEHDFVDGICHRCGEVQYSPTIVTEENYESLGLTVSYIGYYAIKNASELYWFAQLTNGMVDTLYQDVLANAVLIADIVVNKNLLDETNEVQSSDDYTLPWTPIGFYGTYSGSFDGNNHSISGLYLNGEDRRIGLIGETDGTIKNLTIRDSYLQGSDYVGAIVGELTGGSITHCSVENCNIRATSYYSYLGGCVGKTFGQITDCHSINCIIDGNNYVGGLTGFLDSDGQLEYCSNSSTIYGDEYVGSLVGYVYDSYVLYCYNTGNVVSDYSYEVGGLVGYTADATISSCFNYTINPDIEPICYDQNFVRNLSNNYYLVEYADFKGKTKENFKSGEVCYLLNGGNTENPVWRFTIGVDTIPTLDTTHAIVYVSHPCHQEYTNSKDEITKEHNFVHGICSVCGAYEYEPTLVTEENYESLNLDEGYIGYYAVKNAGELRWIAYLIDGIGMETGYANVVLIDDIIINDSVLTADNTLRDDAETSLISWYPIGLINSYEGRFEGNGHTISGVYCNTKSDYQGLFGSNNGIITNIAIKDSYVRGKEYVGGIVGDNYGPISSCSYNGIVAGEYIVGGIVGQNADAIENNLHYGSVSGSKQVGGIAGLSHGVINHCLNIGSIYCHNEAGSIIGYDDRSDLEDPYGHKEYGIIIRSASECYYDLEQSLVGGVSGKDIASSAEGKLTSVLCSNVPTGFAAKDWGIKPTKTEDGIKTYYYPYLQQFGEKSAILAASRPTILITKPLEVAPLEYGEVAESYILDDYFYSADGSKLTYTVVCESPLLDAYIYGGELFLTAFAKGTAVIEVIASMDNGESVSQNVNIQIHSDFCTISLTPTIHNVSCYGAADGSIELTADGGIEPYLFKWTKGSRTDGNLYDLEPGQYTVIVLDSAGCSTIANYTITSPTEFETYEDIYRPDCSYDNGRIEVSPATNFDNYVWKWSNGATSTYIDDLPAGNYSLVLTDTTTGCSKSFNYNLANRQGPTVTIDSVKNSNCSDAIGAAYASSLDSTATFTWSNGMEGASIINVKAGDYYVVAKDKHGCTSVATANIAYETIENPELAVVTVSEESGNNLVVWLREETKWIDYYTIYRETTKTNVYDSIASVPYNEVSVYVDEEADPGLRSWRYKLSATDVCGNKSPLSTEQKTLHLAKNVGMNGEINLSWDAYEGVRYSTIAVYQITTTGTSLVAELPANLHSYTIYRKDIPSNIVSYVVGIVLPEEVDPTITYSKAESGPFSIAISNIAEVENNEPYDAIENQIQQKARIYTIGHSVFVKDIDADSEVVLHDINGQLISKNKANENGVVEFSVAKDGVYIVQTTTTKQLVIVR